MTMQDYTRALLDAGFTTTQIVEIAPSRSNRAFIDEMNVSPFYLLIGQK
jgi:hypothetical protein